MSHESCDMTHVFQFLCGRLTTIHLSWLMFCTLDRVTQTRIVNKMDVCAKKKDWIVIAPFHSLPICTDYFI
jgi:hypothetical protein